MLKIPVAAREYITTCFILTAFLVQGCSPVKQPEVKIVPPDLVKAYFYECNEHFSFVAKFEDHKVWLFLPDKSVSLEKKVSASGTLYSDGNLVFWNKGEQSRLEIGRTLYQHCQNNPAKAIWETAKLNGVDFRATGNEPSWILEIKEYSKTVFITGYGKQKFTFKTPHSSVDYFAKKTTYKTRTNEHALEIFLDGKPCNDSMSGEVYETTVFIGMDGLGYHGCGKALH